MFTTKGVGKLRPMPTQAFLIFLRILCAISIQYKYQKSALHYLLGTNGRATSSLGVAASRLLFVRGRLVLLVRAFDELDKFSDGARIQTLSWVAASSCFDSLANLGLRTGLS